MEQIEVLHLDEAGNTTKHTFEEWYKNHQIVTICFQCTKCTCRDDHEFFLEEALQRRTQNDSVVGIYQKALRSQAIQGSGW